MPPIAAVGLRGIFDPIWTSEERECRNLSAVFITLVCLLNMRYRPGNVVTEEVVQESKFQLREAVEGDLQTIYDQFALVQSIHAEAEPRFFRKPERDEAFDMHFERIMNDPEQHLVLACIDGMPVGHIQFFLGTRPKNIYQPERRFAYIHQLVVTNEHRRSGCATALIEHVKAAAREQSIALLGIDFWSFNGSARACFQHSGFRVNQEHMWMDL